LPVLAGYQLVAPSKKVTLWNIGGGPFFEELFIGLLAGFDVSIAELEQAASLRGSQDMKKPF
jgi:hypothetical protein